MGESGGRKKKISRKEEGKLESPSFFCSEEAIAAAASLMKLHVWLRSCRVFETGPSSHLAASAVFLPLGKRMRLVPNSLQLAIWRLRATLLRPSPRHCGGGGAGLLSRLQCALRLLSFVLSSMANSSFILASSYTQPQLALLG